jgi:hypothetical protein
MVGGIVLLVVTIIVVCFSLNVAHGVLSVYTPSPALAACIVAAPALTFAAMLKYSE